jgi:L-fucose mutarotase
MLKQPLLHPEILSALGKSGHGSRVLIADANYPVATKSSLNAQKIFLNLSPGVVSVVQVLQPLLQMINVESVAVMVPPDGIRPAVHTEFRALLPDSLPLTECKRLEFYEQAQSDDTSLVIATGEHRRFANLLLTIGVVTAAA